jgi:hypothetical protein
MNGNLRIPALLLSSLPLCACGSLGKADEPVDLSPYGIATTVTLPSGGKVKTDTESVTVWWSGAGFIAQFSLDADDPAQARHGVGPDARGVFAGSIPVTLASQRYTCAVRAKKQTDAARLMKICDALFAASPKPDRIAAAPVTEAVKFNAPLELEERTFALRGGQKTTFHLKARTPKGWATSEQLGTILVKDPSPQSPHAISLSLSPYEAIKTLAGAEREAQRADMAGLDTIGDKRDLGPGKFLVATNPRGMLKMTTVRVFAHGKKGAFVATCSGPGERKSELEKICGSASAE